MDISKRIGCSTQHHDLVGPALMDYAEAASYLGTTERHVRQLWQERRLTAVKVGRRVRFAKADLDAFIDRNRHQSIR